MQRIHNSIGKTKYIKYFNMKKIIAITCMIVLSKHLFAQDSTVKKLDELLTTYANMGRFNGSVLVAEHGNILLQKGYGIRNAGDGSRNDVNTAFQIASVTKQFTSTVILKLVELRKMSLEDKLSKYYSGFPNGDIITIEHLLTHTSGLHNFTETDSSINETDEQRMVPYLKTLKPDFTPGTDWHYSNSGYVMLGYIIQKVSGMSYWKALRTYIFEPLHMKNSGFDFTHIADNERAVGYDVLNDSVQQRSVITDSTVPFGAGSIYSTVEDMYKWHLGLQSYKIVGKALMDKAYAPCLLHNYGYGWQIDSVYGKKMVSHSGAISGFGSNFATIPEDDVCVVLLSNKSGSTFDVMHITDKLLAALYHAPYSLPVKRTPVTLSEDVLKKYIGTYEIADMHLSIDITINDAVLIAQPSRDGHPGPTSVMLPMDETHFYDQRDEEVEITFDVDTTRAVTGVTILQMGITHYAKKIR
jgi:CubicO group peptidase (beta-lactamase class C family)